MMIERRRELQYPVQSTACRDRCAVFVALSCFALLSSAAARGAAFDVKARCRAISQFSIADGAISKAAWVAKDAAISTGFGAVTVRGQPAHCVVEGVAGRHTGADGSQYGDRFELRLPEHWSGRLVFQGGSGLDGVLRPALGAAGPDAQSPSTLARGDAVVSTDGGHEAARTSSPGAFGSDPQALADYAYASTPRVMRAVLPLVRSFYQQPVRKRYFVGCSNGGREGLIAAQRYPTLFDGIVAGDPGFDLTRAMVAEAWNTDALASIAPKGPDGRPQLWRALSDTDLQLLSAAVLRQCDGLDGIKDGVINARSRCHFDPRVLACPSAADRNCLAAAKVAVIARIFSGPVDSEGHKLYSSLPFDAGVSASGWRAWMLGNGHMPAINELIASAAINGVALAGRPPHIDLLRFDFDHDPARVERLAGELDATSTNYSAMRRRGGKLLIYQGLSDPVFYANDLIRYYEEVASANGGMTATRESIRLFLVPGMNHCGGGPATDQFDSLAAITAWAENGRAPGLLLATGSAFPGRTRPLCAYPQEARYTGSRDPQSASSFTCR